MNGMQFALPIFLIERRAEVTFGKRLKGGFVLGIEGIDVVNVDVDDLLLRLPVTIRVPRGLNQPNGTPVPVAKGVTLHGERHVEAKTVTQEGSGRVNIGDCKHRSDVSHRHGLGALETAPELPVGHNGIKSFLFDFRTSCVVINHIVSHGRAQHIRVS